MSGKMRAKVRCNYVQENGSPKSSESLTFNAVSASAPYPEDGSDENNTYAKFTPSAEFRIQVANPALFGKFEIGEYYYVDFTPA
jgi:hypothetical protein